MKVQVTTVDRRWQRRSSCSSPWPAPRRGRTIAAAVRGPGGRLAFVDRRVGWTPAIAAVVSASTSEPADRSGPAGGDRRMRAAGAIRPDDRPGRREVPLDGSVDRAYGATDSFDWTDAGIGAGAVAAGGLLTLVLAGLVLGEARSAPARARLTHVSAHDRRGRASARPRRCSRSPSPRFDQTAGAVVEGRPCHRRSASASCSSRWSRSTRCSPPHGSWTRRGWTRSGSRRPIRGGGSTGWRRGRRRSSRR